MLTSQAEHRVLIFGMRDYHYVELADTLSRTLSRHDRIAVDTEFMREKTYFAQLCLIQIATPDEIWCVDPLTSNDGSEFWQAFLSRSWVLHSARQDIEVLYQSAARMPAAIFDTQVAAALLGLPPQIGYAGLVKQLFDIEMDKSHTRADWTRRPLPDGFLRYAAEDVEHLLPAAEKLAEDLDKLRRLDWALQDSALLLNPGLYETGGDQAIDRLKGARNFRGRRRGAAMRLAAWREQEAIERNRPRQWIMRDAVLLEIADRRPNSISQLKRIDGLSEKLVKRIGEALLAELEAAGHDEIDYRPPGPPDEAQKALLKEMQAKVAACAAELDLAPETIASKRELSAVIISGNRESRVFSGWRAELIGDELKALL